jgi:hypothetical protein
MTVDPSDVANMRRLADIAEPHVKALWLALGFDPERDIAACKVLLRGVVVAMANAELARRKAAAS